MAKTRTMASPSPRVKGHVIAVELPGAKHVAVTGSFCGWSMEGQPLTRNGTVNSWGTVLTLPPGRYEYRLVVDGQWRDDPTCTKHVRNSFGTENCVFEI